jgi:hypothetical protein
LVQVVENRADIEGRVLSVQTDEKRPEHRLVTIAVGATAAVEGYAHLFAEAVGKPLDVILPASMAESLNAGSIVRCRVRRTGPFTVFAERCTPAG